MLLDKTLTSLIRESRGKPTYADSYVLLWVTHWVKHPAPAPKQEAENLKGKRKKKGWLGNFLVYFHSLMHLPAAPILVHIMLNPFLDTVHHF